MRVRDRDCKRRAVWLAAGAVVTSVALINQARGADLYWDINGVTPGATTGSTAPGSWGVTNAWSTDSSGSSATGAWINNSTAIFAAGTNATGVFTVTISGNQTAAGLTFEEGTVTLGGGTLTLTGFVPPIDVAASRSATISATIAGTAGLGKTGAGTLVLSGTNTFTGHVRVNGGQLQVLSGNDLNVSADLALGTSTSDGSLLIDGVGSSLSVAHQTSVGANGFTGSLDLRNSANATFSNPITIAQGNVVGSEGFMTVQSGASVSCDDISIGTFGGADQQGALTVTGASSQLSQNGAATMSIGASSGSSGSVSVASGGTISTGTGLLTINSTGSLVVTGGTLNANGDIDVNGGSFQRNASGTFSWAAGKTMSVENGGTVSFTDSYTLPTSAIVNVSGSGSQLNQLSSSVLRVGNGSQVTISSGASSTLFDLDLATGGGNGNFTVTGSGSNLTVNALVDIGQNGGIGTLVFDNGATGTLPGILMTNSGNSASQSHVTVQNGADVTASGNIIVGQGTRAGQVSTITVTGNGSTLTQTGASTLVIGSEGAGTAAINVAARGVFTTGTGATTIEPTGVLNVNGGTLNLLGDLTNDGGQLSVGVDGFLNIGNGGTSGSVNSQITNNGAVVFNRSNDLTHSHVITGTGWLTKRGAGTLTLSGSNTYSGNTSLEAGTLKLGASGVLVDSGAIFMSNVAGAVLDVNGMTETIGFLSGGGASGGNITLGTGSLTAVQDLSTTYSGVISGSGTFTKSGTAALTLAGTNTYTGGTNINAGMLRLGANNVLPNSGIVTLANVSSAVLDLNDHNETIGGLAGGGSSGGRVDLGSGTLTVNESGTSSYGGTISGSGELVKGGTGSLSLSGLNLYSGGTTLFGGTLRVLSNGSLPGAQAVVVSGSSSLVIADNGTGNVTPRIGTLLIGFTAGVDLQNNRLVLQFGTNPSPVGTVRQYLTSGRGGTDFGNATWQGIGGISSSAAAPGGIGDGVNPGDGISFALGYVENSFLPLLGLPSYTNFGGQSVNSGSMLIRFTKGADANLDGRVDGDDVTVVGALYDNPASSEWFLGDFDYDGLCDSDDITVLGALYDATAPALSTAQLSAQYGGDFAAAFERGRALSANVPEPAFAPFIVISGLAALQHRRRRRRT